MDKRKYPPAVQRYRLKHPTISVVLTDSLKLQLDATKGDRKYSQVIKDIITGAFKPAEECAKRLEEAKQTIDTENKKLSEAAVLIRQLGKCRITFPCAVCGGEIELRADYDDWIADIRAYLKNKGWRHAECHERES